VNGPGTRAAAAAALALGLGCAAPPERVVVASKSFTESVILGEIATQLARSAGHPVLHRREIGGTRLLWEQLVAGAIDVYPEYTGTLRQEIFGGEVEDLDAALRERGLRRTGPLGFDNTYALGMRGEHAQELGIRTISDLRAHPGLRLRFSNEFMNRGDGWPSLRERYGLPQRDVRGVEHALAYRSLAGGSVDVTDLYSTDAEIAYYDLRVLEDDLGHFPRYEALLVYRAGLAPAIVRALERLEGRIDAAAMTALNARARPADVSQRVPERRVAADFLEAALDVRVQVQEETRAARIWRTTRTHCALVGISLAAAIALALPLGIACARRPRLGQGVLGAVGIVQTIPAIALLVMLIAPVYAVVDRLGRGDNAAWTAIVALFLYSLLPIVRNTTAGLQGIPLELRESAEALGLEPGARLRLVELPMASRTILAGIKTAAVINVGFATLGGFIGAGGFGQPIFTGIRLDDNGMILEGAVPAALLALAVQGGFELAERVLVPRGLRL